MFNLGAFAGGLAQGIRSGQNMELRQNLAERAAKADERETEVHRARMDKADFNKNTRDRLRAANDEIAADWRELPQQPVPVRTNPDSSDPNSADASGSADSDTPAQPGPVFEQPDDPFSMGGGLQSKTPATPADSSAPAQPANNGSAGLMSQYQKRGAPKTSANTPITADEMIGRRMLTGNLLEDADELTRMANIYKKHGLLKEMAPWMNKAYEAKKRRIPDALPYLLAKDAKSAREILKKGGINLTDDPAPTDPADPQNHGWKFKFEGGSEKDIDLKELAVRFFPSSTLHSIDRALR